MKKGGINVTAVIAILGIFLIGIAVQPGQAISCVQVDVYLLPCIKYLTGREPSPSAECCGGVKSVKGLPQSTADKRATCNCLKIAANRYADLKDAAAESLPGKCDVQLDIPISRTVDCDKIN